MGDLGTDAPTREAEHTRRAPSEGGYAGSAQYTVGTSAFSISLLTQALLGVDNLSLGTADTPPWSVLKNQGFVRQTNPDDMRVITHFNWREPTRGEAGGVFMPIARKSAEEYPRSTRGARKGIVEGSWSLCSLAACETGTSSSLIQRMMSAFISFAIRCAFFPL